MRLRPLSAAIAATAIYGLAGPVPSALADLPEGATPESVKTLPDTWFVQLKGAPTADGNALKNVRAEKAAFRGAATKAGIRFSERYAYDTLFNGLSVVASKAEIEKVKGLTNVAAVWPVEVVDAPEPASAPSPELPPPPALPPRRPRAGSASSETARLRPMVSTSSSEPIDL